MTNYKPQILDNKDFLRKLKGAIILQGGCVELNAYTFEDLVKMLDTNGILFKFELKDKE